jgi:hypothetical protein
MLTALPGVDLGFCKLPVMIPPNSRAVRHQWLTSVILAPQEAEIRRIMVQSQPRQIVPQDPILKKPFTKIGLVE